MKIVSVTTEHPKVTMGRLKFNAYSVIRWIVFWRDNFCCLYCGANSLIGKVQLNLEHVIPKSQGGSLELNNLATACALCNSGKYNTLLSAELMSFIVGRIGDNNERLAREIELGNPELKERLERFALIRKKEVVLEWQGERHKIIEWNYEPGGSVKLKNLESGVVSEIGYIPYRTRFTLNGEHIPEHNDCTRLMDYLESEGLKSWEIT